MAHRYRGAHRDLPLEQSGNPPSNRVAAALLTWSCFEQGLPGPAGITAPAVSSYLTFSSLPAVGRRLFSVALSLGLLQPDVIWYSVSLKPGLSSPLDFPFPGAAIRLPVSDRLIGCENYCKKFVQRQHSLSIKNIPNFFTRPGPGPATDWHESKKFNTEHNQNS